MASFYKNEVFLIICFVTFLSLVVHGEITWEHMNIQKGKKHVGGSESFESVSLIECASRCVQNEACVLINYNRQTKLCTTGAIKTWTDITETGNPDDNYIVLWTRLLDSIPAAYEPERFEPFGLYFHNNDLVIHDPALQFCIDTVGPLGHLVYFETEEEKNLQHGRWPVNYWIGLMYIPASNIFTWGTSSNAAVLTYSNWAGSDPQSAPGEVCVGRKGDHFLWVDEQCTVVEKYKAMCELNVE